VLADLTHWHAFSNPRTPHRTILYYPLKNLAIPGGNLYSLRGPFSTYWIFRILSASTLADIWGRAFELKSEEFGCAVGTVK
jgi:hypothetical protein